MYPFRYKNRFCPLIYTQYGIFTVDSHRHRMEQAKSVKTHELLVYVRESAYLCSGF